MTEAPSSQRAQGNKRLVVKSLALMQGALMGHIRACIARISPKTQSQSSGTVQRFYSEDFDILIIFRVSVFSLIERLHRTLCKNILNPTLTKRKW